MVDRGEEYFFLDVIENIIELLTVNKNDLGLRFIGKSKDFLVAKYPSLYVVLDNSSEKWVAMTATKEIGMTIYLHFYYKNLKSSVKQEEINLALGKIAKLIRKNHSLNGYLGTQGGMTVDNIDILGSMRGEGGIGDGIIEITCIKRFRVLDIV